MADDIAIGFVIACAFVTACFSGLSYYVLRDILEKTGAFVVIVPNSSNGGEKHEKVQTILSVRRDGAAKSRDEA